MFKEVNTNAAKQFKLWLFEDVLPSIRKTGKYELDSKTKIELDKVNEQLKSYERDKHLVIDELKKRDKRIETLEFNQKKNKYPDGGYVYVLKLGNTQDVSDDEDQLLKHGKTDHLNKRSHTYNTSFPDDVKFEYTLKTGG
jgi:hypothetical protein